MDRYITIKQDGQAELTEKKSRFIANVFKIQTQEEADEYIAMIRKEHWSAAHNCYAYQIGERNEIQRFSDDGEPQGTAGKPILDVLKGKDIKNTLIIVTRYFGGTLLGTGGLVRAYGRTAKEGVIAAGLIEKLKVCIYTLEMTYPLSGKVQYLLNEDKYIIRETEYVEVVRFAVEVHAGNEDYFEKWMIDSTNAEVSIAKGEYDYIDQPIQLES